MDTSNYLPLAAAAGLQRALEVTAGNMANATTTGHRAGRVVFENMLAQPPLGPDSGLSYGRDRLSYADLGQGTLVNTGNLLDVALEGDAWFAYATPEGGVAYGRDGRLFMNAEGNVVTANGMAVLDAGGGALVLPPETGQPQIADDGTISTADGDVLGQIGRFSAPDIATWQRYGQSMFMPRDGLGADLEPAENARVLQGVLEHSNVNPVSEMVRMIEIQRAFDQNMAFAKNQDQLRSQTLGRLGQPA